MTCAGNSGPRGFELLDDERVVRSRTSSGSSVSQLHFTSAKDAKEIVLEEVVTNKLACWYCI
jgi:cell fate regulator YaaT (PSP1 superfamily)